MEQGARQLSCHACHGPIRSDAEVGLFVRNEVMVHGRHVLKVFNVLCRGCFREAVGPPIVHDIESPE